jgi:hypothetical protein
VETGEGVAAGGSIAVTCSNVAVFVDFPITGEVKVSAIGTIWEQAVSKSPRIRNARRGSFNFIFPSVTASRF